MSNIGENNHHGQVLENQIVALLDSKKYLRFSAKQDAEASVAWYIPQYRKFSTLYGTRMRLDFLIYHPMKWPNKLAIEVKWQSSMGSVDEKFPYLALSLEAIPGASCAVLLAGGGYRKAAVEWLMRRQEQSDRLIVLEGMDRIIRWANIEL